VPSTCTRAGRLEAVERATVYAQLRCGAQHGSEVAHVVGRRQQEQGPGIGFEVPDACQERALDALADRERLEQRLTSGQLLRT
jgi:hypothetical protein